MTAIATAPDLRQRYAGALSLEVFTAKAPHIKPTILDLFERSRVELRRLQFILSGITSAQARKEIREEIKGLRKMLSRDPAAVAEDVCNAFRIASRERRVSVATRTERTRLRRLRENPAWEDFEE